MMQLLPVKAEGMMFADAGEWNPPHPARWCLLSYLWTVLLTRNLYGPYGRLWRWRDHCFTCYIRLRGPWSHHLWRQIEVEHRHDTFFDAYADPRDGRHHSHRIDRQRDVFTDEFGEIDNCWCHGERLQ